jgi:hypothetical protein
VKLPTPRGPLSARLIDAMTHVDPAIDLWTVRLPPTDTLGDEDFQLALFLAYQMHFEGIDDVDDGWEWHPGLLAFRASLETAMQDSLEAVRPRDDVQPDEVPQRLTDMIGAQGGPAVSKYIRRTASVPQFRELLMHRSLYHLREADPHTFAIPRLSGKPKAALIEIQLDEYGGGRLDRMHASLFADTMEELGLDTSRGAYLDRLPAATLATSNLMSMFGLHRRWRGALLGQLAVFEMNSSLPNRRYGNGLRRLGGTPTATRFFDEHVEADAVHEQIAAHDMCAAFCDAEPDQTNTVLFGAAAWLEVETRLNTHLVEAWEAGRSSLRAAA